MLQSAARDRSKARPRRSRCAQPGPSVSSAAGRWLSDSTLPAACLYFGHGHFEEAAQGKTLRSWHVSLLRSRAIPLGIVKAPDARAAEAAAIKQFGLDDEQRKRPAVRVQD
jgi:hypothetical protein